jgi:hypothetical protein
MSGCRDRILGGARNAGRGRDVIGNMGYEAFLQVLSSFDSLPRAVTNTGYEDRFRDFATGQQFVVVDVPPSNLTKRTFSRPRGFIPTCVTAFSFRAYLHGHETWDLPVKASETCSSSDELTNFGIVIVSQLERTSAQHAISGGGTHLIFFYILIARNISFRSGL